MSSPFATRRRIAPCKDNSAVRIVSFTHKYKEVHGDPERAASLDGGDFLATLLFQVSSPVHIPWGDARWQELLTGYDVWIHAEAIDADESTSIITQACEMMAKHAYVSSNLAALSLHVTRMIRNLTRDISRSKNTNNEDSADDFSLRISRVGKARATAGALQLLRLLSHSVIVRCCVIENDRRADSNTDLEEAFTYHTRGDLPHDQLASGPLLNAIMDLIVRVGKYADALCTPEVYDTIVLAFRLLFVLCGTQLYQDFESSSLRPDNEQRVHLFLNQLFKADKEPDDRDNSKIDYRNLIPFFGSSRDSIPNSNSWGRRSEDRIWTAQSVIETCLRWQIARPVAPDRSIAHYFYIIQQSAIAPRSREMRSADGMYESHSIVYATAPGVSIPSKGITEPDALPTGDTSEKNNKFNIQHNLILDATRGVITLGSTIILLPLRLVSRIFGALVQSKGSLNRDLQSIVTRKFDSSTSSRTKDILWLSDTILSDLSSCLVLLLLNNNRNRFNPFREELKGLSDNRWDHGIESRLPDLPLLGVRSASGSQPREISRTKQDGSSVLQEAGLALNFESLFESFGRTLHTEVGSLLLYTLLQQSEKFAESLVVRSDLDTLVLPLLRTLYFSSQSNTYLARDYASHKKKASTNVLDIRSCPFRSQSQLYVIIILLLLFSQDLSFGRDAFRRIQVPHVLWYKERQLRQINLGSVLFLTILRSLMFNLQRLHDPFILSNCCAILSNLSAATTDLHEYAAMRLVSVAILVMKRHSKLSVSSTKESQNGTENEDDDLNTPLGRYSEVAHSLLSIISDCLCPRRIEHNLQVIYAIVYHQADFAKIFKGNRYPSRQVERILKIAKAASTLIQEASARSAPKALNVLESEVESLKSVVEKKRRNRDSMGDYTFTYEEDADPESFFVPYVWEVMVCVVTSSSIEWKKNDIRAFQLLEPEEKADILTQPRNSIMATVSFDANADDFV